MILSFAVSLILTLVIEGIITLIAKEKIKTVTIINCITNPIVVGIMNYCYYTFGKALISYMLLYFLEIVVIFVEGFFFEKCIKDLKHNPYKFSLLLNGTSFFIGEIINYILSII
ncbi:MAG: hypothetical protein IKG56_05085 [Clostridia bacterium]|nr:hypothetical protein [Clostridia bacterium]